MKSKTVLRLLLCFFVIACLIPPAALAYPGDAGNTVISNTPGQYDIDGRPLLAFVTPGGGDIQRTSGSNGDDVQQYTAKPADGWYFQGWYTWYAGPTSNEANPNHIWDGDWCFSAPGDSETKYSHSSKVIQVNREWDSQGTFYLYAIFAPNLAVKAPSAWYTEFSFVNGTISGTDSLSFYPPYNSQLKIKAKFKDGLTVIDAVTVNGNPLSSDLYTVTTPSATEMELNINSGTIQGITEVVITARKKVQKVTFDANGGTGTMAVQTFVSGTAQALTANSFSRSGYTFDGWNTAANGNGTAYTDKQALTFTPETDGQSTTLYAQWKALPPAQLITAPAPASLTYTGSAQQLVTPGEVCNGTLYYRLGTDGEFSAAIPTGTDAGDYSVYYYVKGDSGYTDTQICALNVTVHKAQPTADMFRYTPPESLAYNGSPKTARIVPAPAITGMGSITLEYWSGTQKLSAPPSVPGTYRLKLRTAEGRNYLACTDLTADSWQFTVSYLSADSSLYTIQGHAYESGGIYWFRGSTQATVIPAQGYQISTDAAGIFAASAVLAQEDAKTVYLSRIADGARTDAIDLSSIIRFDTAAPEISGLVDGGTYYGPVTFRFSDAQSGVASVQLDGQSISTAQGEGDIPADNRSHTLSVTDRVGNTVTYMLTVYQIHSVTLMVDGTQYAVLPVNHGNDATLPEVPTKTGYTGKWDSDGKNITADTTITAIYTRIRTPGTPPTGDSGPWLWLALLWSSGTLLSAALILPRKKRL